MSNHRFCFELQCPACGRRELLDNEVAVARLRSIGKLRRTSKPEFELVAELLNASAGALTCTDCGHVGLNAQTAEIGDDWPAARLCSVCGKAIPPERLELLPDATRCAACQQSHEAGGDLEQPEYCPRCGAIMVLRQARGSGLARYEMVCGECRR